jgi:hypothetical protein
MLVEEKGGDCEDSRSRPQSPVPPTIKVKSCWGITWGDTSDVIVQPLRDPSAVLGVPFFAAAAAASRLGHAEGLDVVDDLLLLTPTFSVFTVVKQHFGSIHHFR